LGGPAEVRELLRSADIFALASRSEGMPRALLEAMALGAPAVATNVGGIPEILPPDQLVPPGDPAALAAAIRATSSDPERYRRISAQGIAVARHYSEEIERRKRDRFLQELREAADLHFEERQAYAC
jgi:glycosyltransferase involved in cell wall biosynthesis